jgi:hypothetical protein
LCSIWMQKDFWKKMKVKQFVWLRDRMKSIGTS